ncbi:hypothetical protein T459_16477 [Capsicum annuum]|uniref:Uncharacterized protein n=1 Tax=Capsicum annuum TaxID=4072 RepID=A0A2G2Z973_CAPAN|nr:hypothetical protein T459_16477 [Capsicum annuum]
MATEVRKVPIVRIIDDLVALWDLVAINKVLSQGIFVVHFHCQNKGVRILEFFSFNAVQFCFHMLLVLVAGLSSSGRQNLSTYNFGLSIILGGMALAQRGCQLIPLLHLRVGDCAGVISMSLTYPMDMVRGRITVPTEKSPYQYREMFHTLSTILREEGPHALYKGWLSSFIGVGMLKEEVDYRPPVGVRPLDFSCTKGPAPNGLNLTMLKRQDRNEIITAQIYGLIMLQLKIGDVQTPNRRFVLSSWTTH